MAFNSFGRSTLNSGSANSMLTGVVMMEDGSNVPGSVDIKVVCNGSERIVGHTTVTDDFEFQWNRPSLTAPIGAAGMVTAWAGANSDASSGIHGAIQNATDYCDLRADLPGYISSEINLNNPTEFDGSNVGVIWLRRIGAPQGNMVSALSLEAPKEARKSFEKGKDLLRSGKLPAAAVSFEKAVTIYPKYADAWLDLGKVQFRMGSSDAARSSLQRVTELDPKMPGAWQVLGYLASVQRKWADAVGYLDHAVELDPLGSPTPWFYSALAYFEMRKFDRAETSIREEINIDPQFQNRRARYLLGLILIARRNVAQGADALRTYLAASPDPRDVDTAKSVLSSIQSFIDK